MNSSPVLGSRLTRGATSDAYQVPKLVTVTRPFSITARPITSNVARRTFSTIFFDSPDSTATASINWVWFRVFPMSSFSLRPTTGSVRPVPAGGGVGRERGPDRVPLAADGGPVGHPVVVPVLVVDRVETGCEQERHEGENETDDRGGKRELLVEPDHDHEDRPHERVRFDGPHRTRPLTMLTVWAMVVPASSSGSASISARDMRATRCRPSIPEWFPSDPYEP